MLQVVFCNTLQYLAIAAINEYQAPLIGEA